MKVTSEDVRKALREAGLEDAGKGVVFPWGVRIIELDGRKFLQPGTPEDFRRAVREETGKELSDEEALRPGCTYADAGCISQGCPAGGCSLHWSSGWWYCLCSY
jgi:hypothetical protein